MNQNFYVAARSQETGGIFGFEQEKPSAWSKLCFTPLKGASYLAYSPDLRFFYAVYKEGTVNKVAAYQIMDDFSLIYLNSVETHAEASCHITTDRSGQFLYCANYLSGNFNEFRLKNGVFSGEGKLISYSGKLGPNKKRQDHMHAHCVCFTPDQEFFCLVDLGLDEVLLFRFTPGAGIDEKPVFRYRGNPGSGPRHLLFSPDQKTAWLANEVDNTVSVLSYDRGTLTQRMTLPTLPSDFTGENTVAAIRLSPNGRHLLVSNRGHDSIACYAVNGSVLALYDIVKTNGAGPRDINFLPFGHTVCACNEKSDLLTFLSYDPETGELKLRPETEAMPGPLCVI